MRKQLSRKSLRVFCQENANGLQGDSTTRTGREMLLLKQPVENPWRSVGLHGFLARRVEFPAPGFGTGDLKWSAAQAEGRVEMMQKNRCQNTLNPKPLKPKPGNCKTVRPEQSAPHTVFTLRKPWKDHDSASSPWRASVSRAWRRSWATLRLVQQPAT